MTDRDKLIELLVNSPHLDVLYGEEYGDAADHLISNGVVVQKHGRWEDGKCSVCGGEEVSYSWEEPVYDYDWEENLQFCGTETHEGYIPTDYCPDCGAKMDLEGE